MKTSQKHKLNGWVIPLAYVVVTLIVGLTFLAWNITFCRIWYPR